MIRLFVLSIGAVVLLGATARGISTPPIALSPKNLADQSHRLSIIADDSGLATTALGEPVKRFQVSIGAKDSKTPLEVEGGYLSVYDGKRFVCRCPVHARQDKAGILFEFVVAPACLAESWFSFTVATASPEDRKQQPAGGGWATYKFTLKDFVAVPGAKEIPKEEAKPGDVKPAAKPRGERYAAYWLTRDPPDPESPEYEPLLLLARYSMEQFADEKEPFGDLVRKLKPEPPVSVIEAPGVTVETYKKDSIWNPDGRPFRPVRSIGDIDLKKRHVAVNGIRYRYEECPIAEAVRLLEYPEGTIPIHRIHKPGSGPAQSQTARALRVLLREQLNTEMSQMTASRVRAFVAYLERNGVKLVVGGERGEWWVMGHGQARGPLEVRIHAFPPVASEKWMRLVLDNTSWKAELNAPARLAVSKAISLADRDKKKPDEVKALEENLLRLFREYDAPADVVAADKGVAKDQEALLAFLKSKGVELQPTENGSNYISQMFTVGPNHDKKFLVGLNYLPPLTLEEASRNYGAVPVVARRGWALFMVGGPGGNATKEYQAVWEKLEAAFKEYPGPAKVPGK